MLKDYKYTVVLDADFRPAADFLVRVMKLLTCASAHPGGFFPRLKRHMCNLPTFLRVLAAGSNGALPRG